MTKNKTQVNNKLPFKWQCINPDTVRAKVIGGWIVRHHEIMVFVPDPGHKWEIVEGKND